MPLQVRMTKVRCMSSGKEGIFILVLVCLFVELLKECSKDFHEAWRELRVTGGVWSGAGSRGFDFFVLLLPHLGRRKAF